MPEDRVVSPEEIDLALIAAEINAQVGMEEGINQRQFNNTVREMKRVQQLRRSGKYRIIGIEKWDGTMSDEGCFDSAEEALAHAYWIVYREREVERLLTGGTKYSELPQELRFDYKGPLPKYFLQNLEEEKSKIRGSPTSTDVLYVYNPKGNLIEEIDL